MRYFCEKLLFCVKQNNSVLYMQQQVNEEMKYHNS